MLLKYAHFPFYIRIPSSEIRLLLNWRKDNFFFGTREKMELALESPLASFEDQQYDGVSALFANESDHMPCLLSFESSDVRYFIRSNAVSQILHVNSIFRQ